jgi:hypothetical protein
MSEKIITILYNFSIGSFLLAAPLIILNIWFGGYEADKKIDIAYNIGISFIILGVTSYLTAHIQKKKIDIQKQR